MTCLLPQSFHPRLAQQRLTGVSAAATSLATLLRAIGTDACSIKELVVDAASLATCSNLVL
jgi:hypothetical protein